MEVKDRIRLQRKSVGLNQEKLSELIGVSSKTLQRWESGERSPRLSELKKLAEALGTTADYLLKGEPFEPEPLPGQEVAQSLPINNAPEPVNEHGENLGLGYWGSVADNARKVAARGDKQDSAIVVALLRKALNSFEGEESTSEKARGVRNEINQVIVGGRENKNEFNA